MKLNQEYKKTIQNIFWLSSDRVFQMVFGIVSSALVTRYLGKADAGILSYVKSYTAFFVSLSVMGLSNLSIRYFTMEKKRQGEVLGSTLFIRLCGALLATFFSIVIIQFLDVEPYVRKFIYIYSLVYFFHMFETFRYWFNSQCESRTAVIVGNFIHSLYAVGCIFLIWMKASVAGFVYLYMIESSVVSFMLFVAYRIGKIKADSPICISASMIKRMLKDCWPLIIGTVSTTIYTKIDSVMLKSMTDNATVGIYSVAVTISELWYFIPVAIAVSLLPKASQLQDERVLEDWQKILSAITLLDYAAVISIIVFAKWMILILYGVEFIEALPIIWIHILAGIFVGQAQIRGNFFIVQNYTKSSLKVNLLGAICNIIFNWFLIPRYGAMGAAIGTLFSYIIYAYVSSFIFKELRGIARLQTKALFLKGLW